MRRLHPGNMAKRLHRTYLDLTYRRQCRLYCVGGPKTGTTSVSSMFIPSIRSAHEATPEEIVEKFIDSPASSTYDPTLAAWVLERDRNLCLDVDASQLNVYLLDYLVTEFQDARFLLTIRNCFSWLKSLCDHIQRSPSMPEYWIRYRDYRFRPDLYPHPKEEQILKDNGLYSLDGYLAYWSRHNRKVLATVPSEKLMILKTNEINSRACDIVKFAGLPDTALALKNSHKNSNTTKNSIFCSIPKDYIEEKVQRHCGDLMEQYFPEISSFEDSCR